MSGLFGTLLGLVLSLLLLSLLVQVLQELWKYVTRSGSRIYAMVLGDMFGPWARELVESGALPNLVARGPFQFTRRDPTGVLLPLDCHTLCGALVRSTPRWVQLASEALDIETQLQDGEPAEPSPAYRAFLSDLRDAVGPARGRRQRAEGSADCATALRIIELLEEWDAAPAPRSGSTKPRPFDAWAARFTFRREFLAHVLEVERDFPQLMRNFDHVNRRRNLRMTMTIALVITALFNQPFHALWDRAARPSRAQVATLVESGAITADEAAGADWLQPAPFEYFGRPDLDMSWDSVGRVIRYAFGCLVTAILLSFGAPFSHDVARRMMRWRRPPDPRPEPGDAAA